MSKFLITMEYEEDLMLPRFLEHYARHFPEDCIYVIDHGRRTPARQPGLNRIHLPRTRPFSEIDRLHFVRSLADGLLRYHDWGVYADCDELIAVDRIDERELGKAGVLHVAGFEAYWEAEAGAAGPPRLLGLLSPGMCKPLIFSKTPDWNVGFHLALNVEAAARLAIPMAHIRFLDPRLAVERLARRATIPASMPAAEREAGFAGGWTQGRAALDEFHRYTAELAQCRAPIVPFEPIVREQALERAVAHIPGPGDVFFWGGHGGYEKAKLRHDLGRPFAALEPSAAPPRVP